MVCSKVLDTIKIVFGTLKRTPLFVSTLIPKNKSLLIFGAWYGKKYSDNTRALFEYANRMTQYNCVWITNSREICESIRKKGYKAELTNSFKGIICQVRAVAAFSCIGKLDFNRFLLGGCIHVECWHGVGGGKKIGYDDATFLEQMDNPRSIFYKKIENYPYRYYYQVCTSEEMKKVFKSAFRLNDNQFIMAGQPRNDMLFDPDYLFTTIDPKIYEGKKIITYMPTHRLCGKKKMACSMLFDLQKLDDFCKRNNCLFIIKKHFYHKDEIENISDYQHIIDLTNTPNIDTNELLMISDYLISDYSSVTADYLLLNRPIFYYCFDLEDYLSNDREMYWPYDVITPGSKSKSFTELLQSLKCVIEDKQDKYADDRERVLNMFYGQQARKMVSQDIMNAVQAIINDKTKR